MKCVIGFVCTRWSYVLCTQHTNGIGSDIDDDDVDGKDTSDRMASLFFGKFMYETAICAHSTYGSYT